MNLTFEMRNFLQFDDDRRFLTLKNTIGPLQDTITWYKIRHTGTQTSHWDIQNKEGLSLSDLSRFVLDVPLRSLRSSMADFVSCDRILQRAYYEAFNNICTHSHLNK